MKFYTELDTFNHIFGYENVFARGLARGVAPLVKFGTAFISSKLSQLESPKFYKHFGNVKIFPLRGVSGAQHPLVKIWDIVYISETIRERRT